MSENPRVTKRIYMYDEVVFMEIMRENNARTVGST
jgi:hypothetical protein